MMYDYRSGNFLIQPDKVKIAADEFLNAIRGIREIAGLPMDRYVRTVPMSPADRAQQDILSGAAALGIDFGTNNGNELDLRDGNDLPKAKKLGVK